MNQSAECLTAQHELVYLGFRVALLDLADRLAARSPDVAGNLQNGFLNEMQWMQGVPLHVQLAVLVDAWRNLQTPGRAMSIRDQCVLHCSCERLATVLESSDRQIIDRAVRGPRKMTRQPDLWMNSLVRVLQLLIPMPAGFSALDLMLDVPPRIAERGRMMFGMPPADYESLLEILGMYRVVLVDPEPVAELLLPQEVHALNDLMSRTCGILPG